MEINHLNQVNQDHNQLNHGSNSSAFDSRNGPQDIWDCCLSPDNNNEEDAIKFVPRVEDMRIQENSDEIRQANSHIARTLTALATNERDLVLNDIHGVADVQEEQIEFIEKQLHLMDAELDKIKSKRAYFIAKSISENYVSNSKFRLKFLRAEFFNPKNAAIRLVLHFEIKLELFGKEKLTKDITLSDLTEEDILYMKTGFFQVCPDKDRSGRTILCSQQGLACAVPLGTRLRVTWYIYDVPAQDEEAQQKGIVIITFFYGQFNFSFECNYRLHRVTRGMPIRMSAIHMCHDHFDSPALKFIMSVIGKNQLSRTRIHHSSRFETIYTLMTFGIPRAIFSSDGEVDTSLVIDFIKQRLEVEETRETTCPVLAPNRFDVLLGKGKRVLGSPGNRHCRELMDTYRDEYEQSSRLQKANITRHILKEIKSKGGRFLKEEDSGWTEVDDEVAKKKISHDFRNLRR